MPLIPKAVNENCDVWEMVIVINYKAVPTTFRLIFTPRKDLITHVRYIMDSLPLFFGGDKGAVRLSAT